MRKVIKIVLAVFTLFTINSSLLTQVYANHLPCQQNPGANLCANSTYYCQGTATYKSSGRRCVTDNEPASANADSNGCVGNFTQITKIQDCRLSCVAPGNNAVCNQAQKDYCRGNDLIRCFGGGFCEPDNGDASEIDGCVRHCDVITNYASCFRGLPASPTSFHGIFGVIKAPEELWGLIKAGGNSGAGALSVFLSNILTTIYVFAGIIFIFMVVWGGFQWITSGGSKEGVDAARKRITQAIIGIAILALAFVIIQLVGNITGFKFFAGQTNP